MIFNSDFSTVYVMVLEDEGMSVTQCAEIIMIIIAMAIVRTGISTLMKSRIEVAHEVSDMCNISTPQMSCKPHSAWILIA